MEYFCEAKPQKGELQTVERTKCAVLQRFVIGGFQATEAMPKPEQEAHPLKFRMPIFTVIWLSGNRKEAEKFEIQFHPPSKPIFP